MVLAGEKREMVILEHHAGDRQFRACHGSVQAASLIVESQIYVPQVILAESYPGGLDGGFHLSLI